jgi:hypothetical protein
VPTRSSGTGTWRLPLVVTVALSPPLGSGASLRSLILAHLQSVQLLLLLLLLLLIMMIMMMMMMMMMMVVVVVLMMVMIVIGGVCICCLCTLLNRHPHLLGTPQWRTPFSPPGPSLPPPCALSGTNNTLFVTDAAPWREHGAH